MYRGRLIAAPLTLLLALAACGGEDVSETSSSTTTTTTAEPIRLPVQVTGQSYGHRSVPLVGLLDLTDGGCWTLDLEDSVTRLVVFPEGYARTADDPTVMVSPQGTRLAAATLVDAVGGVVPADEFPEVPDGFWGNYLAFCSPAVEEFVVLDEVGHAFLPGDLTDAELVQLVREAQFDLNWGCGIGWAASDAAQRVSIRIHVNDSGLALEPPVVLPDGSWTAEVLVGKILMAEWCNDAIEPWVSLPQVIVRWPLSGTLEFTPPPAGFIHQGASVSAMLRGARVMSPVGEIELGDVALVNELFGVFAG